MKKKINSLLFTPVIFMLAGCAMQEAKSSCPELEGSYEIENSAEFYIQKQSNGEYTAMIVTDGDPTEFMPIFIPTKKQLVDENLPECSVILQGAGVLMPSDKNKTYHVTAQSQNYLTERKLDTPLVLMVAAGFQSDVYGVVKTSDVLSKEITSIFSKGNAK
ncbi:hypothetical protein [Mangrovibacter phragmitis]|uniref:hypothetical protein n=1 Tax=Mangrovibacter phragmitis TaxID=1691903 RepID=UPI003369EF03